VHAPQCCASEHDKPEVLHRMRSCADVEEEAQKKKALLVSTVRCSC
jgi:hypothetical protein